MPKGLTSEDAEERLNKYGPNKLAEKKSITPYTVLLNQFKDNILIWILMVAAVVSFLAGEMAEFYFVLSIILIVALMGFFQEWKAEKAMKELEKMASPSVKVYRDGKLKDMPSKKIVPDDVIKLEMGSKIPADAEVLEAKNLKIDESILTGESEPVKKNTGDEIYSGTVVARGRCEAKVIKTGMETKLGDIASDLQKETIETPLQRKTKDLAKKVGYLAIIVSVMLLLIGLGVGVERTLIITVTIAVAVAVVPEALPLTMTLTLSLGMKSLAKQKAVVKKMLAVEGLGA
ncbi:MAG: HAD-IC family P-type ATPase, partial [Candidatus Thermoplasmatota archaeon]|nr:HAD-IC family P-type ATPase [Candidatus Thermoplasmatota archaeon]